MSQEEFSKEKGQGQESLLDLFSRVGIATVWRDNHGSCKGVCDRIGHEDLSDLEIPGPCNDHGCFDEILLHEFPELIRKLNKDAFIVLHQLGSHGPAYYKRVPEAFKRFTPICETVQFHDCEQQSIVNAYDNTIVYTDHVINETIEELKKLPDSYSTALFYVSDHGESLGEYGVYLHGGPYMLVPKEQTHVPMLLWLSENYKEDFSIDEACLKRARDTPLSHDNIFHSMLGLMDVSTELYESKLDLFAPCKQ